MDHMRISGIEPSSVIFNQRKKLKKLKNNAKKYRKKLNQKGWCNKPTKLQFLSILTRKI